ncbi:hypothetical protein, partial [Bradyrhizobium sp. CCBAU 11434]|uniref:hypothetical protein n=1 Tax=Bradyrhizobium sp. CCBAU 11434 TaxID=1630885 RepID=UPI002305DB88
RNPWPASIGTGGRLRSESTADFVGMRILNPALGSFHFGCGAWQPYPFRDLSCFELVMIYSSYFGRFRHAQGTRNGE